MDSDDGSEKRETVTEEPASGWLRIEIEGSTPYYKSPIPRTVLKSSRKVELFLQNEHNKGRMKDIEVGQFSFKRRLGLKKKIATAERLSEPSSMGNYGGDQVHVVKPKTIVERLIKTTEALDHRKILNSAAKKVDQSRGGDGYATPNSFECFKESVSTSADLR